MSSDTWTTYPAHPHALPFRTIFGEYRARRPEDLADAVLKVIRKPERIPEDLADRALADILKSARSSEDLAETAAKHILKSEHGTGELTTAVAKHILKLELTPQDIGSVWTRLDVDITKSEQAYRDLGLANEHLQAQRRMRGEPLEEFTKRRAEAYERVLLAESVCRVQDRLLNSILHAMEGTAVCLSGGGIRSACFSLGILEGLARFSRRDACAEKQRPLLDTLDYLSTVSGGGYIGSWLMAWSQRSDYRQVIGILAGPGGPESQAIRRLREYTSYLSPGYGLTLDTLTLLATVMRNMILNWLILVPLVMALFCLPEFLYNFSYGWAFAHEQSGEAWFRGVMGAAILCVMFASATAVWRMARPQYKSGLADTEKEGSIFPELCFFALPILVSAWLLGEASAWAYINKTLAHINDPLGGNQWPLLRLAGYLMFYTAVPPLGMSLIRLRLLWQSDGKQQPTVFHKHDGSGRLAWGRLVWSFVAPLLVAALAALLLAECALHLGRQLMEVSRWHLVVSRKFVVLVIPIVLAVMMLASTLLSGLLTDIEREEEQEWWARAGGLMFSCLLGWVALNGIAFYAANWLHFLTDSTFGALGLGAGAGYLGSLAAATAAGLKQVKAEQLTKFGKVLAKRGMIAPVLFGFAVLCFASVVSSSIIAIYTWLVDVAKSPYPSVLQHYLFHYLGVSVHVAGSVRWIGTVDRFKLDSLATWIVFTTVCFIALFTNIFIDINKFSLHGMYRMQLTRSYLGASNFARHPDTFTNFDSSDNMYEADMLCKGAPLHIINAALNLATRNLAWKRRNAEPFTFSPISVGSWRLGYLPTEAYGGGKGVTLGTAMAISGAAFDPNMGYASSRVVRLLMSFYNARLGWWLPNPIWPHRRKWPAGGKTSTFLGRTGPKWALLPLLNEALGNNDDSYKWVELSDGGHFENLGLYEMVLRRCHRIIVVDADVDGEFQFEDLGNAIHKIENDLGIPITFPDFPQGLPMKKGVEPLNPYCIRGAILYDCVDTADAPSGELLLIKPTLNGSEPPDIRAYAASHQTFPHEAISNRSFNEAQFENYRRLGSWMISSYFENAPKNVPPAPVGCDMATFFARVESVRTAGQSAGKNSAAAIGSANSPTLPAGEV